MDMTQRPRRLRSTPVLRSLVRETRVSRSSLIYPLFVREGTSLTEEITTMPGQYRYSVDRLPVILDRLLNAGVDKVMLFGIPDIKDDTASGAYSDSGIVQKALQKLKKEYPSIYCVTDVCLCEYTSHGHCGVLNGASVDNDRTLPLLARTALSHVRAGADMVAPSDMMDGRVAAIRDVLNQNSFYETPIMSYAVKYSSAFYGPFREAAGSAPAFGDRKGYQMDYHNKEEALKEAALDLAEGADILMVKPAMSYLDVVERVSASFHVPIAAYSVSGEYAMIKAAARAGYIDEDAIVCETAASVFRAGADILISYYAPEIAGFIAEGRIG
jgi:porphobilinogen synthase